ncbi:MAG: glycoside hydrolase family 20 zincin-like fold domain-containing protein [Ferruginibacter sp.]
MNKKCIGYFVGIIIVSVLMNYAAVAQSPGSVASDVLNVLPFPKEVILTGGDFVFPDHIAISLDKVSVENRFAADELVLCLQRFGIAGTISNKGSGTGILLRSIRLTNKTNKQGYELHIGKENIEIRYTSEVSLFYGIQTLKQLIQKRNNDVYIPICEIKDWPDTEIRAVHYDTKHHQDTREYVEKFIRDLAAYKINMLVWEWEDKFEYPSHPEIAAPGAFTMKEMQEITLYAKKYHIQIVPLVQGLGHASFILKWPQFANLREIAASNFEFCPLKDGTYNLLLDLWKDAMEATPGSKYIHIGSDETYELGMCSNCKKKESEIGQSGLYHLFISRAAGSLEPFHRKVMAWERPMGWTRGGSEKLKVIPYKGLVLTESYEYETPGLDYAKEAKKKGFEIFAYDPNPGIEHLFLPYYFRLDDNNKTVKGCFETSVEFLQDNLGKGVFDGVIKTSWDDSGLPMQVWMLGFATTAAYSWNVASPAPEIFFKTFFHNYFGGNVTDMNELFMLLNEGAYFYMSSFERNVWHHGNIGKTHIPDLPRGDAVEYDPYWNIEYKDQISKAKEMIIKMERAEQICKSNLSKSLSNSYDIEVFLSIAQLIKHTGLTYNDLSNLENAIGEANKQRFISHDSTLYNLKKAENIVSNSLQRRKSTYDNLVDTWNKTRLPKGMSTENKKYFFRQDRTRHFANRTPDMSYLVIDETDLNLENYLSNLREFIGKYQKTYMESPNESVLDPW